MVDTGSSAVEATGAGVEATEAFELLNNDTRLAIMLALWEAYDPYASGNAVPFSELRDRVGVADSGQFNYHLGKLDGQYVEKTDGGYALTPMGLKLVGTVIAGTGRGGPTLERQPIDYDCDLCGGATAIVYRGGWLYHVCNDCDGGLGRDPEYPSGTLFAEPFPPAALENRTPEETFAAGVIRLLQVMAMKMGGLCPRCSGLIEQTVTVCEDHDASDGLCPACHYTAAVRLHWVCTVCKYRGGSSPGGAMMMHPAVVSFYRDHGVDIGYELNEFEKAKRVLKLNRSHETELVSLDPVRVEVTVRYDGDELRLTLDESMAVVDVARND